jgi:hypothetical protein
VATRLYMAEDHLDSAEDMAARANDNIIGGTGEARLCELGVLHCLLALCLIMLRGQEHEQAARVKREAMLEECVGRLRSISLATHAGPMEDPTNRGPGA